MPILVQCDTSVMSCSNQASLLVPPHLTQNEIGLASQHPLRNWCHRQPPMLPIGLTGPAYKTRNLIKHLKVNIRKIMI